MLEAEHYFKVIVKCYKIWDLKSKSYAFNEIDSIENINCEIPSIWKFQLDVSTETANFHIIILLKSGLKLKFAG